MKSKLLSLAILVFAISASSALVTPSANAASSNCTVAFCSPNSSGIIDMRRPLYGPVPTTICTLVNNWELNTAVSFVSGILKFKWFYTWVPSVVCHVVG